MSTLLYIYSLRMLANDMRVNVQCIHTPDTQRQIPEVENSNSHYLYLVHELPFPVLQYQFGTYFTKLYNYPTLLIMVHYR